MKFSLAQDKLLEGLQRVQSVVSTRTTLPILSNVSITATEEGLSFTTTDLDVGVRCTVEAAIERPGATTLPAKRLYTIINALSGGEVSFEVDAKNVASIRCGQTFFKLNGLPQDEFPQLPVFEEAKEISLKQNELKDALRKTAYAISTEETRYVLNGILCAFRDNKMTLVATDGRRLAMVDLELELPRSSEVELIIPAKAVNELQRILKDDEGPVLMNVGDNQVSFELNDTLLVSKLIDGNYPNYRQVIPAEAKERVILEREAFLNSVKRVSLLASDKSNSVKLMFAKNTMEITANSPEVGEARESMAINYKGRDITIAFNPEYLMAPLRHLPNDEIYLDLIDEMSPGVIKIATPFLYVLMPMRISY